MKRDDAKRTDKETKTQSAQKSYPLRVKQRNLITDRNLFLAFLSLSNTTKDVANHIAWVVKSVSRK